MHTDYWREYAFTIAASIAVGVIDGAKWQRAMIRKAPQAERAAMRDYCADVRRMAADYLAAEQERRPCCG